MSKDLIVKLILVVVFVFIIYLVGMGIYYTICMVKNNEIQMLAAISCLSSRSIEPHEDYWGNDMEITLVEEKDRWVCNVISAGYDGRMGTKDDVEYTRYDYNKSKIIGRYLGEKSVEFMKGWVEGRNEK